MEAFERTVARHVERLKCTPYREIERQVRQKRMEWFCQRGIQPATRPASPRQAYELLFMDYMGLPEAEAEVIELRGKHQSPGL